MLQASALKQTLQQKVDQLKAERKEAKGTVTQKNKRNQKRAPICGYSCSSSPSQNVAGSWNPHPSAPIAALQNVAGNRNPHPSAPVAALAAHPRMWQGVGIRTHPRLWLLSRTWLGVGIRTYLRLWLLSRT